MISTPSENCYYRISANCKKASTNGTIQISKVEYFIEAEITATLQSISASSTQAEVYQNAELDTSAITVIGHYDDDSEKVLSSGWTVECDTSVVATGVTATVKYKGFTATFTVDVVEAEMYSLVTDITQLVEGSKIIIAGENNGIIYATSDFAKNNITAATATLSEDNKLERNEPLGL